MGSKIFVQWKVELNVRNIKGESTIVEKGYNR